MMWLSVWRRDKPSSPVPKAVERVEQLADDLHKLVQSTRAEDERKQQRIPREGT